MTQNLFNINQKFDFIFCYYSVEPLPFPQHGPGPIQRPNKLTCAPTQPLLSPYLPNSIQSPGTPDVLDQLNRLLDHQNSSSTIAPSTPNVNNSSISINRMAIKI